MPDCEGVRACVGDGVPACEGVRVRVTLRVGEKDVEELELAVPE